MAKHKKRKSTLLSTPNRIIKATPKPPKAKPQPPTPTIPFSAEHRILLVGEGDFSFAKSLAASAGA